MAPPIVSLVWIASVLSGEDQGKVLRLIDVALSTEKDVHSARRLMPAARDAASTNRESPEHSSDGGTSADCGALFGFWAPSSPPETILLQGDRALLVREIHAIIGQFVMAGNSVELRKLGGQVALKLCREFEGEDFEWLISRLTDRALCELPRLGCTCNELFHLLQSLASSGVSISTSPLLSISRKVVDSFTYLQLRLMGHGKTGTEGLLFARRGNRFQSGWCRTLQFHKLCLLSLQPRHFAFWGQVPLHHRDEANQAPIG